MTLSSWRLAKARYASQPMDGTGAQTYGGRWNSVGTAMIYTSSPAALAAMEVLTHFPGTPIIAFTLIEFQFDEKLVGMPALNALPSGWHSIAPPATPTQRLGDHWVRSLSSAIYRVPGVHVPFGDSYLSTRCIRILPKSPLSRRRTSRLIAV